MAAWGVGQGLIHCGCHHSDSVVLASTIEMSTCAVGHESLILLIFLTLKNCGARQLIELMIWEDAAQIGVLDAPLCHS